MRKRDKVKSSKVDEEKSYFSQIKLSAGLKMAKVKKTKSKEDEKKKKGINNSFSEKEKTRN